MFVNIMLVFLQPLFITVYYCNMSQCPGTPMRDYFFQTFLSPITPWHCVYAKSLTEPFVSSLLTLSILRHGKHILPGVCLIVSLLNRCLCILSHCTDVMFGLCRFICTISYFVLFLQVLISAYSSFLCC